jgi:methyl acetate hydrolase
MPARILREADRATRQLDAVLQKSVDDGDVPGIVAAASDRNEVLYQGSAGRARGAFAMSPSTVFRMASMTKLVTSVAVMMLIEEGELELDEPLARRLPGYRQPELLEHFDYRSGTYSTRALEEQITIRQLLTHTSGYGYWFLDRRLNIVTAGEAHHFDSPFLISRPGERFCYGVSTDVLGQVIAPVSGESLVGFFRRRIFGPLGMDETTFRLESPDRLASMFVRSNGAFTEQPPEEHADAPHGGGGLYSTAADYLTLLRMLLNGGMHEGERLLAPETVAAMTSNQIGELWAEPPRTAFLARTNDFIFMDGSQKFGFGVTIETQDQPSGRPQGSYSWAGIYNTYFWVDPAHEFAATVLMQVQPFADPQCVATYRRFERALYDSLAG